MMSQTYCQQLSFQTNKKFRCCIAHILFDLNLKTVRVQYIKAISRRIVENYLQNNGVVSISILTLGNVYNYVGYFHMYVFLSSFH